MKKTEKNNEPKSEPTKNNSYKERRHFDEDFKKDAVELSKKNGVKSTSKDLGITQSTLSRWRRKYLNLFTPPSNDSISYEELLKENKRLKKEMSYIKDINEVLKKSTAIFSREHLEEKK